MGGRGSKGTAFLLTVMFAFPSASSASLPVIPLFLRSWRTLTCVLVYTYAYAIGYSYYRRGELEA